MFSFDIDLTTEAQEVEPGPRRAAAAACFAPVQALEALEVPEGIHL